MWKVLFYIAVLVTVSKASPENTNDVPFKHETDVNLFDKIGMFRDRYSLVLNHIREFIAGLFIGQQNEEIAGVKPKTCPSCSCGHLGFNDRIIGGNEVDNSHKYPWTAALFINGAFRCGATLINDKYVLTAAHCIYTSQASDYKVRLNAHDLTTDVVQEYNVKQVIRHEGFSNDGRFLNDIALFQLDTDGARMKPDLHPVCLPKKGYSYAQHIGVVTGWGLTDDGIYPDVLREASFHVLSNDECMPYYSKYLTQNMVCAGLRHEGKATCDGDSGGPLTVANGSAHYLVGITSFGKDGCRKPPSVYTRVSEYLDWIKANTKDACPCNNN